MKRRHRSHRSQQRTNCHNPRRNRLIGPLIIAVLLLWIAGCGGGGPTAPVPAKGKAPVAKKKPEAPPATAVTAAAAAAKTEPEYVYNPAGKADPFKPFIQLTSARRPGGVPLTPLQRYEISQLKLVAIIASPGGNVALVEDSAGKGFFLKKGTLVGNNEGKVSKVLKDRVIIEELYQDIYGKTKNAEVTLYLYRPEEEGTEQ